MKVLVTGATGFVGRHTVARLLQQGHEVVAVARNEDKARALHWFGQVRFIAADLHRPPENAAVFFDQPDAVIHLAWPGLPNYKSLFHFEHNLQADYRFLKSLVTGGVGRVLVTGTCFEYGMKSGPLAENLPTNPANPYALAKDTLRQFLEALRLEHPFIMQWARLFYMYGPGQNPKSLIAQLDAAIERGDLEFPMSGGEQLRDYLPVEMVASHLVSLLENRGFQGITNICSGTPISVRRLVEEHLARREASITLRLGHYSYPDYEPMAFWGDPTKLKTFLEAV
jgi:dTDP-6-deoxy-L-talose 4-dehydrogenase (NAD+)